MSTPVAFGSCFRQAIGLRAGLAVCLLIAAPLAAAAAGPVSGRVFVDANANRAADPDESGLADVAISDGHSVVLTAADGTYALPDVRAPFVFVSLPHGYRAGGAFYARADGGTIDFPLVDWPESRGQVARFVQISDTHLDDTRESVRTFKDDLAEIEALEPQAAFVLATGDLVHLGRETPQFDNYREGIATLGLPLFNLPGNHDVGRSSGSLEHYHNYLGPDYYSFNFAGCHFVLMNGEAFDDEAEPAIATFIETGQLPPEAELPEVVAQLRWIQRDLAAAPEGSTIIFGTHFLPSATMLRLFMSFGARAVLSGHWHGHRVREEAGVLDLNSPPLRFGGIDRHPRSFRVIDISSDGIHNELRLGGFERYAVVVAPRGVQSTARESLPILVNAYDTRWKIDSVVCRIGDRSITLRQIGDWSWSGDMNLSGVRSGQHTIVAIVRAENGETWQTEAAFELRSAPAKLQLKWAAPAGGFIGFSSPAVNGSTVVVGSDDTGNLDQCGVTAFNLDGTRRWHFATDSAIKNRVALADGRVFAASVAGWLYALDEQAGELLWKAALGREHTRWETTATIVADGAVHVGSTGRVAVFDAATGKRRWETVSVARDDDWWPTSYTVPVVAHGMILLSNLRYGAFALDVEDGDLEWKLGGGFTGFAVDGHSAYTVWDGRPTALDIHTGRTLWQGTESLPGNASNPVLAVDRVIIGTADGRVRAFSTRDGSTLWDYQTGPSLTSLEPYRRGGSDVNSTPAIADGLVHVGASDGRLHVLSLADGSRFATYDLGVPIASSPVVRDGTVYLGAYDGNVYAFTVTQE